MTVPSEASYDAGAHLNFVDVAIDDPSNVPLNSKAETEGLKDGPI